MPYDSEYHKAHNKEWQAAYRERRKQRDADLDIEPVVLPDTPAIRKAKAEVEAEIIRIMQEYLGEVYEKEGWQALAACADQDTITFFAEAGMSNAEAKLFCDSCPVRLECLTDSFEHADIFGVWGGFSRTERAKLFKEWKPGSPLPAMKVKDGRGRKPKVNAPEEDAA
jgi:WhiB family redox-sensing transcriptional regulator